MKKNRGFISGIVLVAMASLSCAQSSDKKAASLSETSEPEFRWKYDTGG